MVEHKESFDGRVDEILPVHCPSQVDDKMPRDDNGSPLARSQTAGVDGQFDDAVSSCAPATKTQASCNMEHWHFEEEMQRSLSTLTRAPSSHSTAATGQSRFDDASESTIVTPDQQKSKQHTRCCWSDEEIETVLLDLLLALAAGDPLNVLDFRRQWPQKPMPDTRQMNRVLYKLRDEGTIQQCAPNGTNSKPCWKW